MNKESKTRSQSNLNRRGRKPRTVVSKKELEFCYHYVQSGDVKHASILAGYNPWRGYELLKLPRLQSVIEEFEKRKKEECWEDATKQTRNLRAAADEVVLRQVSMKRRPIQGDLEWVKLVELVYKRTGDIGAPKSAIPTLEGQIAASYAVYIPLWKRDRYPIYANDPRSDAIRKELLGAPDATGSVDAGSFSDGKRPGYQVKRLEGNVDDAPQAVRQTAAQDVQEPVPIKAAEESETVPEGESGVDLDNITAINIKYRKMMERKKQEADESDEPIRAGNSRLRRLGGGGSARPLRAG